CFRWWPRRSPRATRRRGRWHRRRRTIMWWAYRRRAPSSSANYRLTEDRWHIRVRGSTSSGCDETGHLHEWVTVRPSDATTDQLLHSRVGRHGAVGADVVRLLGSVPLGRPLA